MFVLYLYKFIITHVPNIEFFYIPYVIVAQQEFVPCDKIQMIKKYDTVHFCHCCILHSPISSVKYPTSSKHILWSLFVSSWCKFKWPDETA